MQYPAPPSTCQLNSPPLSRILVDDLSEKAVDPSFVRVQGRLDPFRKQGVFVVSLANLFAVRRDYPIQFDGEFVHQQDHH